MSDVVVRDATPEEFDATSAMMVEAYRQYEDGLPPHLWQEYRDEIADVCRRIPQSRLILAARGREILGAVTYYEDATLSDHKGWPPGYAEMRLLAVPPSSRGLGVGRLLAEETLRRARAAGRPFIGLHTSSLMAVAKGMYERMGFERVPEFDFVPDPDLDVRAIAYRLALDAP